MSRLRAAIAALALPVAVTVAGIGYLVTAHGLLRAIGAGLAVAGVAIVVWWLLAVVRGSSR